MEQSGHQDLPGLDDDGHRAIDSYPAFSELEYSSQETAWLSKCTERPNHTLVLINLNGTAGRGLI